MMFICLFGCCFSSFFLLFVFVRPTNNYFEKLTWFCFDFEHKKHIPVYGIRSESEKTNNIYRA